MNNETFSIILRSCGQQKLLAVKVIKEACNLGLKESKDVVDMMPSIVKSGMTRDEAMQLKDRIDTAQAELVIEVLPDEEAKKTANEMQRCGADHYDKGNKGCMLFLLIPLALASMAVAMTLL